MSSQHPLIVKRPVLCRVQIVGKFANKLYGSDTGRSDGDFGFRVAISGDGQWVAVTDHYADSVVGMVYLMMCKQAIGTLGRRRFNFSLPVVCTLAIRSLSITLVTWC
jgi:hypothetical protein